VREVFVVKDRALPSPSQSSLSLFFVGVENSAVGAGFIGFGGIWSPESNWLCLKE
jgi:hypothetical protein